MAKRKKLKSFSSLENKLDRLFSIFIRKRDADEGGTVSCVTCRRLLHWTESDAGHFVKRQHRAVRWEPCNAAPQCKRCNRYMGGRQDDFASYLMQRYGREVFDELMSKKYLVVKHSRAELEQMIERYSV
jgi:5-methylcytosine-specific restriction endonuclease McrA